MHHSRTKRTKFQLDLEHIDRKPDTRTKQADDRREDQSNVAIHPQQP